MNFPNYLQRVSSLKNKTIIVSGANSGIGFAFTKEATNKGASVYLACRNEKRANEAIFDIKQANPNANLAFLSYDQADFASIDNFVKQIESMKIDVLVLNAGILRPGKDLKTAQGFSLTVGTNYCGLYHLLSKLECSIRNGNIEHIVLVTSVGRHLAPHKYLNYMKDDKNKLFRAYFASKKMIFQFAGNLKCKYPNLKVSLMHPGVTVTKMTREELHRCPKFLHNFGDFLFKLFANTKEVSALSFFEAIEKSSDEKITYAYPKGLLHIKGYPASRVLNQNKIKSDLLETASNELFS